MLTGSADASIKLWSLLSHRCLHTFAHHTESVWSIHSSHPSLSIFYSGDRSGNVCRVDMEGCAEISEGECVLICKETPFMDGTGSEGINGLIALDDRFVWTATSSSSINCWKAPATRMERLSEIASPPLESDQESISTPPSKGVSPFGFSIEPTQPSAIRPKQRESFGADKDGWLRSDSPVSLSDSPLRKSDSIFQPRSMRKLTEANQTSLGPDSFPSTSSLHTALGAAPNLSTPSTLFGLPYQSLIKLAPPNGFTSPFGQKSKDAEVSTLYSAVSIKSVPMGIRHFSTRSHSSSVATQPYGLQSTIKHSFTDTPSLNAAISSGQLSARFASGQQEEVEDSARLAFEAREIAAEAQPLHSKPFSVIDGTEGIVRSVILNDRWHALTVDTVGHVGVWDVVRGICVGVFDKADVERASRGESAANGSEWKWSPREALEVVRERIEGEAVVQAWCTLDSSIGNLMVHITSGQAFEAEIYADEAGFGNQLKFEDDHRRKLCLSILDYF